MSTSQGAITCKAAVCWGLGMTVKLEEIQVDPPKSGEVRVKMLCASICHTDVSGIQGSPYVNGFPLVPGHEGVGVVETVGDEVKNLKEGDMVIPTYIGECGHCRSCVSGKTNLCLTYTFRVTAEARSYNTLGLVQRGWSTRLSMPITFSRLIQASI